MPLWSNERCELLAESRRNSTILEATEAGRRSLTRETRSTEGAKCDCECPRRGKLLQECDSNKDRLFALGTCSFWSF
jgi:hypothetical protein